MIPIATRRRIIATMALISLMATVALGLFHVLRDRPWRARRAVANLAADDASAPATSPPSLPAIPATLQTTASQALKLPLARPRVVISKSARRAALYDGSRLVKEYRCALGGHPVGDKERLGDGRTPEGTYYICQRNAQSKYVLFQGLNYPLAEDAGRGLRQGLISRAEYDQIVKAEKDHACPPWLTGVGGAIGLHGGGASRDWTRGCIAFDDPDIAEIWAATAYWTPVEIRP